MHKQIATEAPQICSVALAHMEKGKFSSPAVSIFNGDDVFVKPEYLTDSCPMSITLSLRITYHANNTSVTQ